MSGKEWAAFRLGHTGVINAVEVDTHHFKCNFPDSCYLEGCYIPAGEEEKILKMEGEPWVTILPSQKLLPNKPHYFSGVSMIQTHSPINVVRLIISPDGGIGRLRLWGHKAQLKSEWVNARNTTTILSWLIPIFPFFISLGFFFQSIKISWHVNAAVFASRTK